MTDEQQEVWTVVRESNRARIAGAIHELEALLDPQSIAVSPGFSRRAEGRDAVVRALEEERHHVRVDSFEELEHMVDVFGDFAMVTYRYEMRARPIAGDEEVDDSGQDVVALRRSGGKWKVLWRASIGD